MAVQFEQLDLSGYAKINDTTPSARTTYSSQKIEEILPTVFDQVEQSFPGWVEDKPITSLETADRTVAGGINELLNSIGVLMGLKTDAKTSLVAAINELVEDLPTVFDQVEQSFPDWASTVSVPALLTSNKTLTGAINEVNAKAGSGGGGVEIVNLVKAADSEGFTINSFSGYAAKQGRIVTIKINAKVTTSSPPFMKQLCSLPEVFSPYNGETGTTIIGMALMSIDGAVGMANLRARNGFLCMTYETDNLNALNNTALCINLTYLAAE